MEGCIASPHWEACSYCINFHPQNGCNVKESDNFYVADGEFIICGDYEKESASAGDALTET